MEGGGGVLIGERGDLCEDLPGEVGFFMSDFGAAVVIIFSIILSRSSSLEPS